jgi:hypothetical protein
LLDTITKFCIQGRAYVYMYSNGKKGEKDNS